MYTAAMLSQSENAPFPNAVTLDGIVMLVSPEQESKQCFGIRVTVFGITMLFSLVQARNAYCSSSPAPVPNWNAINVGYVVLFPLPLPQNP